MRALLWKRWIEFKSSKIKILFLIFSPIIYYFLLINLSLSSTIAIAYFPLCTILISNYAHWNVEDLIHGESLLVTSLNPFILWWSNCLFVSLSSIIYSIFLLFLFNFPVFSMYGTSYTLSLNSCTQSMALSVLGIGLIAISTVHNTDFSKFKQYFTSIFGILNFFIPLLPFLIGFYLPLNLLTTVLSLVIGITLTFCSIVIARKSTREKLVINIQKLSEAYEFQLMND
ncbi:hypothetical protein CDO73_12460 [Saccharibacillus sp. O23]|nr:hypothetical protein CDO73_12460 [Saccharibacillus sp. O23]